MELAIIGGTGIYRLPNVQWLESRTVETRYGNPSGPIRIAEFNQQRVAFIARHGEGHSLPPHLINYRANLQALKELGIKRVLAINTVGGITENYGPRILAIPDQLIDYTWGRISTVSYTHLRAHET
jgi:5'-methylthioinosine phosphorylase